jgi:hypothetical protein
MNQALFGNILDKERLAHGLSAMEEGFLFGGLSPPNKKSVPLRPPRLRGGNVILDRHDQIYKGNWISVGR